MPVKTIYVVRHGFRSNWVVNHTTGEYTHNFPTPTGIPSDPSLASHGVEQAQELATHLAALDPAIDQIYSSPFYRCLQTLAPTLDKLNSSRKAPLRIRADAGIAEFYGKARFDHPRPASLQVLSSHFPAALDEAYTLPSIEASASGETVPGLHDRVAYALHAIIARADAEGAQTILLCTHAAVMIALGRALTGRMPEDEGKDDFRCATCAFSKFVRRGAEMERVAAWDRDRPDEIPDVRWRGRGVQGGWECEVNGDCSFLSGGEERGWRFSGDESFLKDPDRFNNPEPKNTAPREDKAQRRGSPRL